MPQVFHLNPDNNNQAVIDNTERGTSTDISNLEDSLYLDIVNENSLRIRIDQYTSDNSLHQYKAFIDLNYENAKLFCNWINQTEDRNLRIDQRHDNLQCNFFDIVNNIFLIVEQLDIFTHQPEERASFTIHNHNIQPLYEWLRTFFS
ncbi:MAG: hypothetical protein WC139_00025 [Candidatus Kapaibacterium sp.]